jgi:hypothetical protein
MKLHFFSVPLHGPAPAALDALLAGARVATIDRHFVADGPTHPVHTHSAPQSTNTPACYPPPERGRWRAAPEGDYASPQCPTHPEPLSLRRPAASTPHQKTTPPKPYIPVLTQWNCATEGEHRGPCWRARPRLTHSLGTLHCPRLFVGRPNRGRLVASRSPPPARCATSPSPREDNHQISGRFILPRSGRGACAPRCFSVSVNVALASTATVDSVPRANHQLTAPGIVGARFIGPNVHSTLWPFVVHIRIRTALHVIAPPFITLRRRAPNDRLSLAKAAWVRGANPFRHEAVEGRGGHPGTFSQGLQSGTWALLASRASRARVGVDADVDDDWGEGAMSRAPTEGWPFAAVFECPVGGWSALWRVSPILLTVFIRAPRGRETLTERALVIKPQASIGASARGDSFLGFVVWPGRLGLGPGRRRRYVLAWARWEGRFRRGAIDALGLQQGITAAIAITAHAEAAAWRRGEPQRRPPVDA